MPGLRSLVDWRLCAILLQNCEHVLKIRLVQILANAGHLQLAFDGVEYCLAVRVSSIGVGPSGQQCLYDLAKPALGCDPQGDPAPGTPDVRSGSQERADH